MSEVAFFHKSAGGRLKLFSLTPSDVNLIDVLDFIADCVMAGMGRSGSVYPLKLSPKLLERAFQNTVEMLKSQVVVSAALEGAATKGQP